MRNKKPVEAKLVMVGDVGVGKSSITVRYILDKFDIKMESTLGAAYMQKIHMVHESEGFKQIKLKIWDTAGQEKYKAIAKLYYKDCQAALVIYDVTRKQTFLNIKNWVEQLTKHAPKNIGIPFSNIHSCWSSCQQSRLIRHYHIGVLESEGCRYEIREIIC